MLDRLKTLCDMTRPNLHTSVKMLDPLPAASDVENASIAEHFARQPPTSPNPGPRAAEGKDIFERGVPVENVIACNLCHGAHGEGHNVAPRLAGQHAEYLRAQLIFFEHNIRRHGETNVNQGRVVL
jgi:cytochrome c553